MESDHGVFKPRGLQFTGSVRARDILKVKYNILFQFAILILLQHTLNITFYKFNLSKTYSIFYAPHLNVEHPL